MSQHDISWKGATFYSHLLPSLDASSWRGNRVAGDGWMAVGDAAGLVDPITGEGLYYAIRSGDLAAQTIVADACAGRCPPAWCSSRAIARASQTCSRMFSPASSPTRG